MPEGTDPTIQAAEAAAALNDAIAHAEVSESGGGVIHRLPGETSAVRVLRSAWVASHGDEEDDGFDEVDSGSWVDTLCEILGAVPSQLVMCWNPSSMVSGMWGLGMFASAGRGYLYSFPDDRYGVFEDENPLYAAWEPADSDVVARDCFITVYRDVWDKIGLPPWFGEVANGPLGWMTDAILGFDGPLSVYVAAPSGDLLEAMIETGSPETVATELNIPAGIVKELLSDLREHGVPDDAALTGDRGRAFLALSLDAVSWPTSPS
jgi:hypothetical protein